ncbi:hypothetical protein [Thermoleptolyngbya sp. C42_A2020_037]|uniref:hypothetical protein n=1 Tax=Thermoleptolyngbya sp. C42_A2020_037 TaxID=2747799 RepID=UPI0019E4177C|nr:hypothetical protein [Thermoleptolyngbya sp. C42_A2020_037]MBF2083843.1 hypothetical protein [Thermoleptolyngbya sp. C42_A2020_037]
MSKTPGDGKQNAIHPAGSFHRTDALAISFWDSGRFLADCAHKKSSNCASSSSAKRWASGMPESRINARIWYVEHHAKMQALEQSSLLIVNGSGPVNQLSGLNVLLML